MDKRWAAFAAVAGLCLAADAKATTVVIDFETGGDGTALEEGDEVGTEWADLGLTIELLDVEAEPFVTEEGKPTTGYGVWGDRDKSVSGAHALTDGQDYYSDYGFSFVGPVDSVGFWLIDFGDCTTLYEDGEWMTAYLVATDADGQQVDIDSYSIERFRGGDDDDGNVAWLEVSGSGIWYVETQGADADCGTGIDDLTWEWSDDDGDGVDDWEDSCWGTAEGDVIDADGCSVADYCPCDEMDTHGAYQSCVVDAVKDFVDQGLLSKSEGKDLRVEAAHAECPE